MMAMGRSDMTVEQACGAAGVTSEFVRNLGRDGSKHPSFFRVMALAAVLRCSPFWLAGLTEEPLDMRIP